MHGKHQHERENLILFGFSCFSHFTNCVYAAWRFPWHTPIFKFKMCLTKTMTELNGNKKNFSHVMHTLPYANQTCVVPFRLMTLHAMQRRSSYICLLQRTRKIYAHFIDRMEIINMSHKLCVCIFVPRSTRLLFILPNENQLVLFALGTIKLCTMNIEHDWTEQSLQFSITKTI